MGNNGRRMAKTQRLQASPVSLKTPLFKSSLAINVVICHPQSQKRNQRLSMMTRSEFGFTARQFSLSAYHVRVPSILPKMKLWIVISVILALCIVPTVLAASEKPLVAQKRGPDDLTCERA